MTQNRSGVARRARRTAQFRALIGRGRRVRNTAILVGLLLSPFGVELAHAAAERGHEAAPTEFSAAACYQLVRNTGRQIAWARWEQAFPVEKTRAAVLRDGSPSWAIDLQNQWISDAYQWHASDEQIRQWAAELGSVDNLPRADDLSVHESIAIWMRRIGRECGEYAGRTKTAANAVREK